MKNQLEPSVEKNLQELENQINSIKMEDNKESLECLLKIMEEINQKEENLNLLIEERNQLQELENQLRHIKKKSEIYDVKDYEANLGKKYNHFTSQKIKRKIDYLGKILILLEKQKRINLWDILKSFITLGQNTTGLQQNGIQMYLWLEEYYLTKIIEEKKRKFEKENFEKLKEDIKNLYIKNYIPISKKILNQTVRMNFNKALFDKILEKIELAKDIEPTEDNPTPILKSVKNNLIELYPIVLTTVDSIISNYWSYFDSNDKVDYVIIDESSQCDILSALPLLYIARNIIIVGDQKQLTAITNIEESNIENRVEDEYNYAKENFLSSISKTIKPVSKMLLEHYRCDYNIINFCNKFFYENKLKIYKDAKKSAMLLIDNDKGKYVEKKDDGYENRREIGVKIDFGHESVEML